MPPLAFIIVVVASIGLMLLYIAIRGVMLAVNRSTQNQRGFVTACLAIVLFLPLAMLVVQMKAWGFPLPEPWWPDPQSGSVSVVGGVAFLSAYAIAYLTITGVPFATRGFNDTSGDESTRSTTVAPSAYDEFGNLRWVGVVMFVGGLSYVMHMMVLVNRLGPSQSLSMSSSLILMWFSRLWPLAWMCGVYRMARACGEHRGLYFFRLSLWFIFMQVFMILLALISPAVMNAGRWLSLSHIGAVAASTLFLSLGLLQSRIVPFWIGGMGLSSSIAWGIHFFNHTFSIRMLPIGYFLIIVPHATFLLVLGVSLYLNRRGSKSLLMPAEPIRHEKKREDDRAERDTESQTPASQTNSDQTSKFPSPTERRSDRQPHLLDVPGGKAIAARAPQSTPITTADVETPRSTEWGASPAGVKIYLAVVGGLLALLMIVVVFKGRLPVVAPANTLAFPLRTLKQDETLHVLIDSSKDLGIWWFPQGPEGFDPSKEHQGKRVADAMRQRGWKVTELPRGETITGELLQQYDVVFRPPPGLPYSPSEIEAYRSAVGKSGLILMLFAMPMRYADALSESFDLKPVDSKMVYLPEKRRDHPIVRDLADGVYLRGTRWSAVNRFPTGWIVLATGKSKDDVIRPVMGVGPFGTGAIFWLGTAPYINGGDPTTFVQGIEGLLHSEASTSSDEGIKTSSFVAFPRRPGHHTADSPKKMLKVNHGLLPPQLKLPGETHIGKLVIFRMTTTIPSAIEHEFRVIKQNGTEWTFRVSAEGPASYRNNFSVWGAGTFSVQARSSNGNMWTPWSDPLTIVCHAK